MLSYYQFVRHVALTFSQPASGKLVCFCNSLSEGCEVSFVAPKSSTSVIDNIDPPPQLGTSIIIELKCESYKIFHDFVDELKKDYDRVT